MIYVADSESGSVGNGRTRTEKRGIRIGSIADGKVIALIPDPNENATNTSAAEGVAVDAAGNIYGAEVGPSERSRSTSSERMSDHSSAHPAPVSLFARQRVASGRRTGAPSRRPSRRRAASTRPAQAARGEQTYMSICVACHPAGHLHGRRVQGEMERRTRCRTSSASSAARCRSRSPATLEPEEYAQTSRLPAEDQRRAGGEDRAAGRRQGAEADPHRAAGASNAGGRDRVQLTKEERACRIADDPAAALRAACVSGSSPSASLTLRGDQQRAGTEPRSRARQQAGRVALLGRRRVEHALLPARPDQRRRTSAR